MALDRPREAIRSQLENALTRNESLVITYRSADDETPHACIPMWKDGLRSSPHASDSGEGRFARQAKDGCSGSIGYLPFSRERILSIHREDML